MLFTLYTLIYPLITLFVQPVYIINAVRTHLRFYSTVCLTFLLHSLRHTHSSTLLFTLFIQPIYILYAIRTHLRSSYTVCPTGLHSLRYSHSFALL